jgi:hypothetical protein
MTEGFVKVLLVLRWSVNAVSVAEVSVQLTLICVGETGVTATLPGALGGDGGVVADAVFDEAEAPAELIAVTRY